VNSEDVVYDFGCGDGRIRILLEALVQKDCRFCLGVEIEKDLVDKANSLANSMIQGLPKKYTAANDK